MMSETLGATIWLFLLLYGENALTIRGSRVTKLA
jgi:hypothetical protein